MVDYARTTVSQPPERGARCSGAASESVQPGAGVHLVWSPSPGKDAVRPRTPGDRGQGTGDGLPSRHHPPRSVVRRALGAGRAFCGPEPCALGPGPSPSPSSSLPLSSSSSSSPSPSSGIPQEACRSLSGGGEGGSRVTTETPRFSIRAAAGPSSAARVLPAAGRRPAVPAQARPGLPTCTPSTPGLGARARRGPQSWGPFGEKSFARLKATKASHVAHPAPSCPGSVRGEDAAPRGGGPWADSLRTGRLGFTTPAACVVSLPGRTFPNVLRIKPAPRLSPDRPLRFPATAPNSPGSSFGERGGRRGGAGAPAGAVAPWRTPPPVAATDGVTGRGWGGSDLAGCRTYLRLPQRLADSDAVRGHVSGAKGADRGAASRLQRTQHRALPASALGAGWL